MTRITRSSYTWLAYGMLGYFAYMQASLGPVMPFLRDELNLNYSVAGLHLSLFALGMSITGMTAEPVVRQLGRYRTFWLGGVGMTIAGLGFILARLPILTLGTSLFMGLLGGYLLIMVQATLADEFGKQRAVALTESNIVASVFAALAPAVVGFGIGLLNDWRLVLWFGIAFWTIAFVTRRTIPLPQRRQPLDANETQHESLPPLFWLYWTVLFAGVAVEWCVIFWTPDFLVNHRQLPAETASLAMTLFFGAVIVGRVIGSRLSFRYRALYLLLLAQVVALIGFPLLWLSNSFVLTYIGLILVGLGVANFFPLGLATASNIGAAQSDKASARISQAAGLAILIVPLLLGNLADRTGIFIAYGVVLGLLLIQPLIVGLGLRMERLSKSA